MCLAANSTQNDHWAVLANRDQNTCMASCISTLVQTASAPARASGTVGPVAVTETSKPARWNTFSIVSVSAGRPAGRFGWAAVSIEVTAVVPSTTSNSNSTGWKEAEPCP